MHIERLMKKNKVGSMQWSPLLQSEFSIIIIAFCSLCNQKIILQSTLSKMDTYGMGTMCPSCRESNKGSKERQGPNLGSLLQRCPSYRESNKGSKERQGPTLGVHFTEVSIL